MAVSIADLLDDPDPQPPDTTLARKILGSIRNIAPSTADTIFSALGIPSRVIQPTTEQGDLGYYNPQEDQIYLSPHVGSRAPNILAHELTHEKALNKSPNLQGIMNVFLDKWQGMPIHSKLAHLEDYYGKTILPATAKRMTEAGDTTTIPDLVQQISDAGFEARELHEVFGMLMERAFKIARQADLNDPSKVRGTLEATEAAYPGTREAFNFWIQSFQNMER